MRIVVHGQQAFGKAVLEALLKRGENVVAVYAAPEKEGAKADPLKEAALAAKLPVFQPDSYKKPEVLAEFKALKPDLQVMAFVTLFVPEEFLNAPTKGSIQYHPSLLPAYRGASAINWPSSLCSCRKSFSTRRPRVRSSITRHCCRPIAAPARSTGLRHFVRAGRVSQRADQGFDPVSPVIAAGLSRRQRDQLAFVTLFVPEEFLNAPTKGSIQYHPSLLPAYRGASAINWPSSLCSCRKSF